MKVLILGGDGYLGWPTAMHLSARGFDVAILDNSIKRSWEHECDVKPLIELPSLRERCSQWNKENPDNPIRRYYANLLHRSRIYEVLDLEKPQAIVHYAEQPSAPYSMRDGGSAFETQRNNVLGTLNLCFAVMHHNPQCHIVKLGTMGEYGTPNIDIEEGWLDVEHNGREDTILFPKRPLSWYHASKVHDSANLEMACRIWGMRVTDLNQGVVWGTHTNETFSEGLHTSFHYDAIFGTVINRFITQAVMNETLTVYGKGGQCRGFINIQNTMECVELAIRNPPRTGEFQVMNQLTEVYSILELAAWVARVLGAEIESMPNPRNEEEDHYYNVKHSILEGLGLEPIKLNDRWIKDMANHVEKHKSSVLVDTLRPSIQWRGGQK